jgi:hypothetical protein
VWSQQGVDLLWKSVVCSWGVFNFREIELSQELHDVKYELEAIDDLDMASWWFQPYIFIWDDPNSYFSGLTPPIGNL